MRKKNELVDLAAFAMVAEERSFTRAAARLGVTPSALSHSMRSLEKKVGLQLLARTTRNVSPTEGGKALLKELVPALERIQGSLSEVRQLQARPTGRIRLVASRAACSMVLIPKLSEFTTAYPDVKLEVTASNDPIDLVAKSFDVGIAIGEYIQKDMIAVRVSGDLRLALVGTPAYLANYPAPQNPRDLKNHQCIGFRFSSGLYRWEFEKGRRTVTVSPDGPITFDDSDLVLETVLKDIGLGMHLEGTVRPLIEQSRLIEVLKDWSPKFPGHFLYYPSRRNQPAALAALIRSLRISE